MSADDIGANVVLTADNQQYDASMNSSASATDRVGASVDTLGKKIGDFTRSAGKKFVGVGLVDTAAIAAGSAAWASYEKQMASLSAQSAVLSRTQGQQERTMQTYTNSVKQMRSEFGTSTSEAAALTQQISKMSDNTRPVQALATTFTKMAQATGESSQALSNSVLNLQRTMGTPQRDTARYADQLTTLSASANTSAEGLASFAASIGPIGRTIGLSQTAVTGVSKAFVKAGQDGYSAGNAFNKIVSDIAYASATGSPELAKYANLIGVTVKQFKSMSGEEKVTQIFDRLGTLGPKAVTELNRLGLDGVRYAKAITAVSQSGGGIGQAIRESESAFGDGSTGRGATEATKNITDEFAKLREQTKMTAESLGQTFEAPVTGAVKALEGFAHAVRVVMESPLGKLIQSVGALAGGLSSVAGAGLLAAPLVMKAAAAYSVIRSAGGYGFREGITGRGGAITADRYLEGHPLAGQRTGMFIGGGGARGDEIANSPKSTWFQRGSYNVLNTAGAAIGGSARSAQSLGYERAIEGKQGATGSFLFPTDSKGTPLTGRARFSATASAPLYGGAAVLRNFVTPGFDQARYTAVPERTSWVGNQFPGFAGSQRTLDKLGQDVSSATAAEAAAKAGTGPQAAAVTRNAQLNTIAARAAQQAEQARLDATVAATMTTKDYTTVQRSAAKGMSALAKESGDAAGGFAATARKLAMDSGRIGMSVGGSVLGAAGGVIAQNPLMFGAIAAPMALEAFSHTFDQSKGEYSDMSGAGNKYMSIAGMTEQQGRFSPAQQGVKSATMASTKHVTGLDAIFANSKQYKMADTTVKGLTTKEAIAYLAPQWSKYDQEPQARQAAIYDLLAGGMNQTEVNTVIKNLDEGKQGKTQDLFSAYREPTTQLRIFGSKLQWGGTSNKKLIDMTSRALGTVDTRASMTAQKEGSAAGALVAGAGAAQVVGRLDKTSPSFDIGPQFGPDEKKQAMDAFAKERLGGVSLSGSDWAGIVGSNKPGTPGGGQAGYVTDFMKSKQGPKDTATFYREMLERAKGTVSKDEYEQMAKGTLASVGAAAPKDIRDTDAIYKNMMTAFTKDVEERKTANEQIADNVENMGKAGELFAHSLRPGGTLDKLSEKSSQDPVAMTNAVFQQIGSLQGSTKKRAEQVDTFSAQFGGDESQPGWQLLQAAKGAVRQKQGIDISMAANPVEALGLKVDQLMGDLNTKDTSATAQAAKQAAPGAITDAFTQEAVSLKQQMIAQEQFALSQKRSQEDLAQQMEYSLHDYNLQRSRSEEDFHRQQMWQLEDYNRSRKRAEEDYKLSRARSEEDFNRSLQRSQADFNLSRKRTEQDYQHSIVLMVENSAKSMMDIYKRVQVEQTNSASWLLVNSADQIERMQRQEADLAKLRKMGMSDDSIQQLGLTDPNKQQQLARFVTEVTSDPGLVKKFNEQVSQRLDSAKKLVTDDSSTEWKEFTRQHRLQVSRSTDDFERNTTRSIADHRRQMGRMDTDFRKSLSRMAEDLHIQMGRSITLFGIQMQRGATDYATMTQRMAAANIKMLKRARQDINLVARGMSGDVYSTFVKASKLLKGEQGKQAGDALDRLKDTGVELSKVNWAIAKNFWDNFDLPGKIPKWIKPKFATTDARVSGGGGDAQLQMNDNMDLGFAHGGVTPGYTPGRDVHHYYSETGGDLHLSGGEAIMVPEWTKKVGGPGAVAEMNRKARQGRGHFFEGTPTHLADGGTFQDPDRRVSQDGEPLSAISAAQLLLAEKLSHKNFHVIQGSWQPHTSYSGSSHMGPGVMDTTPGNFDGQFWMRRVGFAAWGRNFPGAAHAGSGAHVHSVSRLDPGARNHPQLSSFARGEDGLGGKDYGPNPSVLPGIFALLGQFKNLSLSTGGGGGGVAIPPPSFESMTKTIYKALEESAAKNHIGGVGFDKGWWSDEINKKAKIRYNQLKKNWVKSHDSVGGGSYGDPGSASGPNQELMRRAMKEAGWNQWGSLYPLEMSEAGFNNRAQNPTSTAYGMGQFLDSTWGTVGGKKTSDPWKQSVYMMRYIKNKYGDPNAAWNFHQREGWYGDGGLFDAPSQIGVGENGPEAVIPLNEKGSDFMSDVLTKVNGGLEAKNGFVSGSTPLVHSHVYNNYRVDKSTNFTGPINVTASNPRELLAQLQAQQRLKALSQPVLAGSR